MPKPSWRDLLMILYRTLDRLIPHSFPGKVISVAILFGQVPLVVLLAAKAAGGIPPVLAWPALAVSVLVSGLGLALSVRAVLQPVSRLEEALAAYQAGEATPWPLPDTHQDIVGRLMRHANSLMLSTETRIDAAERLAECDPLTGLLNRRGLERRLAARHGGGAGGALLMVDADHFKRINDLHGHAVGDRVLRDLASVLRRQLRQQDLAARFGGEEFVLYLSALGRARALQVAERLRMAVEDGVEIAGHSQTVSIGIAIWSEGQSLMTVLRHADAAVYAAKRTGRNRSVLACQVARTADGLSQEPNRVHRTGAGPPTFLAS